MTKPSDLTGKRFGKLTAICFTGSSVKNHGRIWKFACDCGSFTEMAVGVFNSGAVLSCGCVRKENGKALGMTTFKHGEGPGNKTKEYRAWTSMKERCYCETKGNYASYGGRGVKVCERWLSDYSTFLSDMGRAEACQSLDRINVDGDYEPSNCRWADAKTQSRNRRNSRFIEVGGKQIQATELAEAIGVDRNSIYIYERVRRLIETQYELD